MSQTRFLEIFEQGERALDDCLVEAEQLFSEAGWVRLQTACSELRHKLSTNTFNLVVMGQFKRGKSTFINALLGAELLPAAVVPLTSAVTIVRYGHQLKTTVYFLDGRCAEIGVEAIADYITERNNPKNQKNVGRLVVEYPAGFLRDGVQLIDTPGVGSVFGHNTDAAYDFLPHADAVLFLVSADPPISEAELKFLADVRQHAGKIFFIKNKIDHLSAEELEESLAFTREVIAKEMQVHDEALKIFPLSAKWALHARLHGDREKLERSQLPNVERALGRFLMREKGAVLLRNARRRTLMVLEEAMGLLDLEARAVRTPQEQLAEKMAAFEAHKTEVQQQKDDIVHLLDGGVRRILDSYDDDVVEWKKAKLGELEARLRRCFDEQPERNARKLAAFMEQALRQEIEAAFTPWRHRQEEKVDRAFRELAERLAGRANAAIDRIYEIAGELFDLSLRRYEGEERLADEKVFFFKVGGDHSALDPFENLLTYGVATLVSKKILLKKTLAELPPQFDRQCGRVRADLLDRLRESAFAFQARLTERIDEAYAEIQTLVGRARQQHQSGAEEIGKRLAHLRSVREKVVRIHAKVSELNLDGYLESQETHA